MLLNCRSNHSGWSLEISSAFMFTFPHVLSLLILPIILIRASLCAAAWCFSTSSLPSLPTDCRYILTHLPSIHTSVYNSSTDAHALLDPSSPFLPSAYFIHESCSIGFQLSSSTTGPSLLIEMTETGVMESWKLMRTEAASIVDQCLDHGQAGVATDQLDAVGHHYTIEIDRLAIETIIQNRVQWTAMANDERMFVGRLDNRFWGSIYVV